MASFGNLLKSVGKGAYATVAHGNPYFYQDQANKDQANNFAYAPSNGPAPTAVANSLLFPQQAPAQPQTDSGIYGSPAGLTGSGTAPSAALNTARGQVNGERGVLDQLFQSILDSTNSLAASKKSALDQNYGQQLDQLGKTYTDTYNNTGSAYAGRGAYDSSYRGNAQQGLTDTYNTNQQGILNNRANDYAGIGQLIASQQAQVAAQRPQYDLNQYTDPNDVNSLLGSLKSLEGNLRQSLAGLGTNSDYINKLNGIAPTQNTGAQDLQSKLQALVGTPVDPNAKQTLLKGYINQNGQQDQTDYWTNYFQNLLKQQPQ